MSSIEEQIREAVEREMDSMDDDEIDEFLTSFFEGESTLPVDRGFEVFIRPTPGDEWDESHPHVLPMEELIVLHLCPEEARLFDAKLNEFLVEWAESKQEFDL